MANADYPFGIEKIEVDIGRTRRVVINPDDPESVYEGLSRLVGLEVCRITMTPKTDPDYEAWKLAVANDRYMGSFSDWKEKKNADAY